MKTDNSNTVSDAHHKFDQDKGGTKKRTRIQEKQSDLDGAPPDTKITSSAIKEKHKYHVQKQKTKRDLELEIPKMLEDEIDDESNVEAFVISWYYHAVLILLLLLLHFSLSASPVSPSMGTASVFRRKRPS